MIVLLARAIRLLCEAGEFNLPLDTRRLLWEIVNALLRACRPFGLSAKEEKEETEKK